MTTAANRQFFKKLLEDEGARLLHVEHGGKHPKLVIEYHGRTFRRACPSTPGDHRSLKNFRTQIRRTLHGDRR